MKKTSEACNANGESAAKRDACRGRGCRAGLREVDASARSPGRAACILARTARRAGRPRVPATDGAPHASSLWPTPAAAAAAQRPHASRRWPTRACQKRDGAHSSESLLSKSNNNPRMHARELSPYHSSPPFSQRCEPPTACATPPTACIALRPAYTHKYTHIFRRMDRSLLAATSRASRPFLPARVRPRVSLPTLPVDRMQQLWDHMYPDSMYIPATSVYPRNIPIFLDA